jgi:hypothetical protein
MTPASAHCSHGSASRSGCSHTWLDAPQARGYSALDSAELLAYECASRNQWKQQKFILLFSAL